MKNLPYFRWYPADAETDENFREMSDAEIGFYVRCLNHAWLNGGITSDPAGRTRILKVTRAYHDKMWVRVGRCFHPSESDPSRLVNKRQEEERTKATEKSRAAANSVRTRYEKSTNVDKTKDERSENEAPRALARADSDSDSDSSVSALSDSEQKTPVVSVTRAKAPWEIDEQFEPFVNAYMQARPNTLPEELQEAYRPFLTLSFEQRLTAVRGIVQRVQWGIWSPGKWQMITKPSRYLQTEWKRVITQPVDTGPPVRKSKSQTLVDEMNEWALMEEERERAAKNGNNTSH